MTRVTRTPDGGRSITFEPTDFHRCPVCGTEALIRGNMHGGFLGDFRDPATKVWSCNGVELRINREVVGTLEHPYKVEG